METSTSDLLLTFKPVSHHCLEVNCGIAIHIEGPSMEGIPRKTSGSVRMEPIVISLREKL